MNEPAASTRSTLLVVGRVSCVEETDRGNLASLRDGGDAGDYVEGMWMMVQQDKPDDYVLATGEGHSVREFVELAFAETGRKISWSGQGVDERGIDTNTGDVLVEIDPKYFRPTEID